MLLPIGCRNPPTGCGVRERLEPSTAGVESWVDIPGPPSDGGQLLTVLLRADGDLQVAWSVPMKGVFEQLLVVPDGEDRDATEAAAALVSDILGERVVLGWHSGFFRGGRRFIAVQDLPAAGRDRGLKWTVSWHSTHNWQRA